MLFDLQGKRRRVVQATYLTLAVLMGGGLVLFGVGGSVSGGLLDAFTGGNSGSSGSDIVKERVERNETRVKRRPRDKEARAELVRDYYSLAYSKTPSDASSFSADAKDELEKASVHWDAYLELTNDKPDPTVARVALQIYDQTALNKPDEAVRAARLMAERAKDPGSYLQLVQYAVVAKDERTQKLAKDKALALARNAEERKAVRDQLKQIAKAQIAQQIQAKQLQKQLKLNNGSAEKGTTQPAQKQGSGQ
jgi:hypothetical protein